MDNTNKTIESLDKTLSVIIEGTTEKGTKLVEWLYTQAPEVVQQLLLWHGVESFMQFIVGMVLLIGGPIAAWKINKKFYIWAKENLEGHDHPVYFFPALFCNVFGLIVWLLTWANNINLTWLKIWIAPKVYLLEYLAQLVK